MKKIKFLPLFLCLCLLLQPLSLPVSGDETEATEAAIAPTMDDPIPEATEPVFGTVCVKQGCRTIEGMTPLAGSDRKLDTAQAAFLYEVTTDTVVYSLNPDTKMAPGSLAKLANAYVAMQTCSMDDRVVLTSEVYRLPSGAHHGGLKPEEELTISDLVHSVILDGANDAAIGLAIAASGTQQAHVTKMNQWVQSIGCTSTNFTNVHGLDNSECTTTARDMVKLYMAAIQDETIKTLLETRSYTKAATNKNPEKVSFRTRNYLIDEGTIPDFQDSRVKGGIQSYNSVYGASLAIHAEDKSLQYIGVILNATRVTVPGKDWKVTTYGNFNEMTDLLKLGFDGFKNKRILYNGQSLGQFTVSGGECDVIGQCTVDVDSVVPVSAQMDNLIMNFKILNGNLTAPIQKGEKIATMQIEYRGSVMAETEVYAMNTVKRSDSNGVTIHSATSREQGSSSSFLSVLGTICVIGFGIAAAYLAFNAYMRNRIRARRRKRRAERRRNR